jgi:hypothetical protein
MLHLRDKVPAGALQRRGGYRTKGRARDRQSRCETLPSTSIRPPERRRSSAGIEYEHQAACSQTDDTKDLDHAGCEQKSGPPVAIAVQGIDRFAV